MNFPGKSKRLEMLRLSQYRIEGQTNGVSTRKRFKGIKDFLLRVADWMSTATIVVVALNTPVEFFFGSSSSRWLLLVRVIVASLCVLGMLTLMNYRRKAAQAKIIEANTIEFHRFAEYFRRYLRQGPLGDNRASARKDLRKELTKILQNASETIKNIVNNETNGNAEVLIQYIIDRKDIKNAVVYTWDLSEAEVFEKDRPTPHSKDACTLAMQKLFCQVDALEENNKGYEEIRNKHNPLHLRISNLAAGSKCPPRFESIWNCPNFEVHESIQAPDKAWAAIQKNMRVKGIDSNSLLRLPINLSYDGSIFQDQIGAIVIVSKEPYAVDFVSETTMHLLLGITDLLATPINLIEEQGILDT